MTLTPLDHNDDLREKEPGSLAVVQEELQQALQKLRTNYEKFVVKYKVILPDAEGIHRAIQEADKVSNIRDSARVFSAEFSNVLRITQDKKKASDAKWTNVITNFLSKFYPLARLSLNFASAVASVCPLICSRF